MSANRGQVRITLPAAPPQDYIRWMAFWRDVETKMAQAPRLAEMAGEESAPFVRDPVADFLSKEVVRAIAGQALEAERAGEASVEPVISGDRALLEEGMDYVIRRGGWMAQPGVMEALGVRPLEDDLVTLRMRAVQAVAAALGNTEPEG